MSKMQQLGIGIALFVALIVALVLGRGSCDSPDPKPDQAPAASGMWQAPPQVWSGGLEAEVEARLELDPRRGPILRVDDETSIELTPSLGNGDQDWTYEVGEERIRAVGVAEIDDARVESQWDFSQGNPQAHFSMTVDAATASAFPDGLSSVLEFPPGEITHVDNTLRVQPLEADESISGWTPGWIRWAHGGTTLTYSSWWADRTIYQRSDDGAPARAEFVWVDPRVHRAYGGCDEATYSVSTRMMVSLGDLPIVLPSRFSGGASAIVAPVFASTDSIGRKFDDLERIDAKGWEARARTLALGHSSSEDPRHGNGGLLGAHLGGTFIWDSDPAVRLEELSHRLSDTRVEVDAGAGPVLAESWCDDGRAWLSPVEGYESGYRNGILRGYGIGLSRPDAVGFEVAFLDGERQVLLEQALSRLYMERLKKDRGLFAFVAPLVATRNPLNDAFAEALLVPERHGEWTLSPEVVRTFAELEMWRESNPDVRLSPVSALVAYWQNARRCETRILESGELELRCPQEVEGYTIIAHDSLTLDSTDEEEADDVVSWVERREDAQTWIWTPKKVEQTTLNIFDGAPSAVRWVTQTQP